MNTNVTGLRLFSKIFAFLFFVASALENQLIHAYVAKIRLTIVEMISYQGTFL